MPEPLALEKAELREMDAEFKRPLPDGPVVKVQFNPETLKVVFANQLVQPAGAGDQRGQQARQFVGAGTTKLTMQLWFDVSARPLPPGKDQVRDVRELTREVSYFITPKPADAGGGGQGSGRDQLVPPAVRFVWGTFQFDGMLDSLEESLELWSPEGRPLRASLSLGLSQQRISVAFNRGAGSGGPGGGGPATPGTRPLTPAPEGASLQALAGAAGVQGGWQSVARANGIENPRALAPGQLVDLSLRGTATGRLAQWPW